MRTRTRKRPSINAVEVVDSGIQRMGARSPLSSYGISRMTAPGWRRFQPHRTARQRFGATRRQGYWFPWVLKADPEKPGDEMPGSGKAGDIRSDAVFEFLQLRAALFDAGVVSQGF